MPLPTEQFIAQARKAGRTISWRLESGVAYLLALFVGLMGLLLFSSVPWFGVLGLVIAAAIIIYAIRRVSVGRHRDLICPTCGVPGEIVKIEHSYQYHCARCQQTADTGVSSHG